MVRSSTKRIKYIYGQGVGSDEEELDAKAQVVLLQYLNVSFFDGGTNCKSHSSTCVPLSSNNQYRARSDAREYGKTSSN